MHYDTTPVDQGSLKLHTSTYIERLAYERDRLVERLREIEELLHSLEANPDLARVVNSIHTLGHL